MRVAFGWYTFKIKSFSAKDLNINEEEWPNTTFEVRQKVFHIFWMPFFSLGKVYALRRQGKLYELPDSVISIIKQNTKVRTPWYSFLIPILAVAAFTVAGIIITVGESIMKNNSYKQAKEQYEISINDVQRKLSNLHPNAYLRLVQIHYAADKKTMLLKLIETRDNTYSFQLIEASIPKFEKDIYSLHAVNADTLTFTKKQLQSAVCKDYDDFIKKESCGFNFFGGSDKYIIDAIEYFDGAVIDGTVDWDFWETIRTYRFHYKDKFTGYKNDRSWNISFGLQNFGVPVNLIQIKNIAGDLKWSDSLPLRVNRYEYLKSITIQGIASKEPEKLNLRSLLTFQDSLNRKYEYILEAKESLYTIKSAD